MFYSDTVEQRLREIGVAKLAEVVTRNIGETAEAFYTRVVVIAADRFGGYSVSHVSGRYKAAALMTRHAALEHVTNGGRYLIDETTAVVRFLIPCQTGAFEFSDTLEPVADWFGLFDAPPEGMLDQEVNLIRKLFFLLFVETVVRTVKGEEEIWLVESGVRDRLYRWERVSQ